MKHNLYLYVIQECKFLYLFQPALNDLHNYHKLNLITIYKSQLKPHLGLRLFQLLDLYICYLLPLTIRLTWNDWGKIFDSLYSIFIYIIILASMQNSSYPLEKLFSNIKPLLTNHAPFKDDWEDTSYYFDVIQDIPIMVVGAGGLGSEIVKNLALSGVRNIHLVDMDTVDFTNLNRQFMFRQKDVGFSKADAVASFIKKRCPGVQITTHKKRVQNIPFGDYLKFPIIIGGLDNVQARKYLNNIVFQINESSQQTICYYIDGATEGFLGQALLVEPYKTSCYECSLFGGLAEKPKANYCTIANTPRTPEHCIQYVLQVQWQEERGKQVRDNDNLEHMQWIYQRAKARAQKFNIQGVTEMLTLGVTKNIIPAIASTNALIAAICTNQALKIISGCNPTINNYIFYKGATSVSSDTYAAEKLPTCRVCLTRANRLQRIHLQLADSTKIEDILNEVKKHYEYINKPFITYNGRIFMNPGQSQKYSETGKKTLGELIQQGRLNKQETIILFLSDKCLRDQLRVDGKILQK